MRRLLVIYDFATAPLQLLHSEFPYIWGKFDFLFYQCRAAVLVAAWWHRQRGESCSCWCIDRENVHGSLGRKTTAWIMPQPVKGTQEWELSFVAWQAGMATPLSGLSWVGFAKNSHYRIEFLGLRAKGSRGKKKERRGRPRRRREEEGWREGGEEKKIEEEAGKRDVHCTENGIYMFPEKELRSLSPNSYIHMSVSDLYIPRMGPHIWLQQNRQTYPRNI